MQDGNDVADTLVDADDVGEQDAGEMEEQDADEVEETQVQVELGWGVHVVSDVFCYEMSFVHPCQSY